LGGIFACGIFNLFALNSTTKRAITKWRPWLDLARQTGPETTLKAILIVVEGCFTAEKTCGSGLVVQMPIWQILLQRLWLFYLALLQPNQHS
jgi:hypothetical protein